MTKQEFFELCSSLYNTLPDYPFDDWMESAVFRHSDNNKWYAIILRVSRRKFGIDSDELIDVVNLKLPTEMFEQASLDIGAVARRNRRCDKVFA